jgi:hypothetical protein
MTKISMKIGEYGQLFVFKEQTIQVFGRPYKQEHTTLIPAFAVEEFKTNVPKEKREQIKLAFLLLGKYSTPITKHSIKALIGTAGKTVADSTILRVTKEQGLRQIREQGSVFYEALL